MAQVGRQPLLAPAQSEMTTPAVNNATAPSSIQAVNDDALMAAQEQTPAYRALFENNLICNQYRIRKVEQLDLITGTSDMNNQKCIQVGTCNGCFCLIQFFVVQAGCVRRGTHSDGRFFFFGPGVHTICSPYVSVVGPDVRLTDGAIVHGTKAIVTVTQGFVGLAMDRGQPVLLPPGLHQWESDTIQFQELIDLASSLIRLGPYTLITVDEGYAAVTQDNGEQKILEGGRAYMLTHRNWKFEKFMTKKLQTNDVGPIAVTTGDNVPLEATATVNWVIEDAKLAARMAANTMSQAAVPAVPAMAVFQPYGQRGAYPAAVAAPASVVGGAEFDITKLRQDVIRQVVASLAAFIGTVKYASHGHAGMAKDIEGDTGRHQRAEPDPEEDKAGGRKALFDRDQLSGSVQHANDICQRYGVKILSINLISASPSDRGLLDALSQGAVATVAAEQTTTAAAGEAAAMLLKARAEAEAMRIRAHGDAEAESLRAEGSLKAATQLGESEVAVALAKLKTAGQCLKDGQANSFFFGLQSASDIPAGMLGSAMAEAATSKSGRR